MSIYDINEKDWKVFRKLLPGWQEAFMGKLLEEYAAILVQNTNPSERFWKLEDRIYKDKRLAGVSVDMRRSRMIENITELLSEGAITMDDLNEFSEEFRERIRLIIED